MVENPIETFQLRLPGVWTDRHEGCPHLWQGICTLKWDICSYTCQPIQYCTVFRDICHQWSIDAGYITEKGELIEKITQVDHISALADQSDVGEQTLPVSG